MTKLEELENRIRFLEERLMYMVPSYPNRPAPYTPQPGTPNSPWWGVQPTVTYGESVRG